MKKAVIFDMYETLITHYKCPLYFSEEMAADAGISERDFQKLWRGTNRERTVGKITFEEIIEQILTEYSSNTKDIFQRILSRRIWTKEETFRHLHKEILPMLDELKNRGVKIGLISNCFSEEAEVIRRSILYPYFDAPCMSWEEGVEKPDLEIFRRCVKRLGVESEDCLYVGDGGSRELEAASQMGMKAVQAMWYVYDQPQGLTPCKDGYDQLYSPMDIVKLL